MAGVREALTYAPGEADPLHYRVHIPEDLDVRAVRKAPRADAGGLCPALRIQPWAAAGSGAETNAAGFGGAGLSAGDSEEPESRPRR